MRNRNWNWAHSSVIPIDGIVQNKQTRSWKTSLQVLSSKNNQPCNGVRPQYSWLDTIPFKQMLHNEASRYGTVRTAIHDTYAWIRLDKSDRPPTPAAGPPMAFDIIPDILEQLAQCWHCNMHGPLQYAINCTFFNCWEEISRKKKKLR